jgi:uncharacterized protein (TIGR02453 family)
MAESHRFAGFPKEGLAFLRGLASHNDKAWFDAHRGDYQARLIAPAMAFVSELGAKLRKVSPVVQFEPRINGSIFRMNRDIRFSKDKTTYKTHLDLWFWEGGEKGWETTGFFFRMFPDRLILGAGMHTFGKPQLDAYRAAVVAEKPGKALQVLVAKLTKGGGHPSRRSASAPPRKQGGSKSLARSGRAVGPIYTLGGATRKKVPRGFDEGHPRAGLLLHEGLFLGYEGPVPKEVHGPGFVAFCLKHFKAISPLNYWLYTNVVGK